MNNIYSLINELEYNLDREDIIIKLRKKYQELSENKELINKINKYKETNENKLREEIILDPQYREISKLEGELNYIIFEINKELKNISKRGGCKWKSLVDFIKAEY